MSSCTTFENIPCEILLDIFEHLDIYDIYQSFSNLNTFLNCVINNHHLSVHSNVTLLTNFQFNHYYHFVFPQIAHRLKKLKLSFHIDNDLVIKLFDFNQFISGIETLTLLDINSTHFEYLSTLTFPNLKYLCINTCNVKETISVDVYERLLTNPLLKSCKLELNCSIIIKEDIILADGLEHLTLNWCSIYSLFLLLKQQPKLNSLHVTLIDHPLSERPWFVQLPINLYLTNLHLNISELITINKISSLLDSLPKLRSLIIIGIVGYPMYFSNEYWEKYISTLDQFTLILRFDTLSLVNMNIIQSQFLNHIWTKKPNFHVQHQYCCPFKILIVMFNKTTSPNIPNFETIFDQITENSLHFTL
ncbi:unnamed protein product [Didymodactylos carnosus]|uniref:F-box domain-containing protein n=1 Tax=Didymodactylos carnosus TaxID=1234261 RepID=A0A814EBI3_9BILA|nr:unnamed protein product [Didymodactylos carnosus]CAF0968656.1 unnamed protein product [Didymodactylos carnosus]CAF3521953.1 unnamed protein product [Didymodactylos carnosus]CAF3741910.1 unnamed protein product [Didymodactylos carnosus]